MTIGEKIREIRKEKGISQKELGTLLGVSQQMIGQYENSSREPKIETLRKIATALEVKLSDFLEVGQIINQYIPEDEMMDSITKKEDGTISRTIGMSFHAFPNTVENTDPLTKELNTYFSLLNHKGKLEAIKRVKELSELPAYNNNV